MPEELRIRKLRWLCRRGMKELDVLLEAFLAREAEALRDGAWPELETLLAEEDDVIWHWVLDPRSCHQYPALIESLGQRT
jgi:antitoxin CptB